MKPIRDIISMACIVALAAGITLIVWNTNLRAGDLLENLTANNVDLEQLFKIATADDGPIVFASGVVTTSAIECVDIQEVIDALSSLIGRAEPNTSGYVLTVCNTCECWHPNLGAEYYECKAHELRKEAEYFQRMRDLLEMLEANRCVR